MFSLLFWSSSKQPGRHVVLERGQSDDNNYKLVCSSEGGGNAAAYSSQDSNQVLLQMFASLDEGSLSKHPVSTGFLLSPTLS